MVFVVPSRNAGGLNHATHGAAVVGSIEQKIFDDGGVASHKAAAQAGHVAAFGQTCEGDQTFEFFVAQKRGRF